MSGLSASQRLLRRLVRPATFAAIEAESRCWLIEGACGSLTNVWDAGGIRYKARGTKYKYQRCPVCGTRHRFKIFRASTI